PTGYAPPAGAWLAWVRTQSAAAVENRRSHEQPLAAVPTNIQALRPVSRLERDIGAALNLDELLQPAIEVDAVLPVSAYGQSVDSGRVHALARAQMPSAANAASGPHAALGVPDGESVSQRMARLAEAVARDSKHNTGSIALEDIRSGLEAFCRGAGIAAESLPPDAQGRLLHLAGRLFREAFVGFKDLERTRRETRNRYRIETPPHEADDPRPSLSDSMVEELLVALLVQHEGRRLDSVQWLRETFWGAKLHEHAGAQATRAAFVEFLDRLDPAELEARFERAARRGKARAADKAQYWELFTTFYRNLIERPADHLPHTFVEAFATAYREALKKQPPETT